MSGRGEVDGGGLDLAFLNCRMMEITIGDGIAGRELNMGFNVRD